MIEVTEEMRAAFRADRDDWCGEIGCGRDDCLNDRLAAVLAIVERELPRCPYVEWGFKVRLCSLPFGHDGNHDLKDRVIV
ncbi:hypothetical protein [Actinoplanes palleronii]|uniref:Uncharacterized protein n=1 Tax=Actinoplanes palleronii TaxID=113570 RepID=A0ABQ4B404_9ACTN|nr:hypothetical protein [Actinoplanes palleronii]GIE65385.1 hypothetical protein Apa02nite_014930 [Actinoplanes palleronii]